MRALTYCWFRRDSGERTFMVLRAHLTPMDAMGICLRLGLPMDGPGDFGCARVTDALVELFLEHAEKPITQAKAQELFGDKWEGSWPS